MKSKSNYVVVLVTINLLSTIQSSHAQQAWTRAKGAWYAQVGISAIQANRLLNGGEELIQLDRKVTDLTLPVYAEYGVTNRLTLVAQVPFKFAYVQNEINQSVPLEGSLAGLSNVQAGIIANFFKKNDWVVSGKTTVQLPTARFESATGLRTGFDALSVMPSVAVGLGRRRFFTSAEAGYVFRTNGYSNRIFGSAQGGTYFGKRRQWLPIIGLELMKSGDNSTYDDGTSSTTGLYLGQQSYLSPFLKIGYLANAHTYLWLSVGGGIGAVTRKITANPGFTFSVSYQR